MLKIVLQTKENENRTTEQQRHYKKIYKLIFFKKTSKVALRYEQNN